MLSEDHFSYYLRELDEKTIFLPTASLKFIIVNVIKSKLKWCSSHKFCMMLSYYNFHLNKTWLIIAIPLLERRLFGSPNMKRGLLNLFNLA